MRCSNTAKMANRYPDQGLIVRSKIAEINNLDGPENVMIGNGSSEVYDNIFRMFIEQEEVIQHTPCFGIYNCAAPCWARRWSVPMVYKDNYLHFDPDGILNAITDKTKIIVIANPNNPTGNFMARSTSSASQRRASRSSLTKPTSNIRAWACRRWADKKYPNVLITRTLSKAYGLAGMRFGYASGTRT
jgi:histidinol-phosphate aminotransferase